MTDFRLGLKITGDASSATRAAGEAERAVEKVGAASIAAGEAAQQSSAQTVRALAEQAGAWGSLSAEGKTQLLALATQARATASGVEAIGVSAAGNISALAQMAAGGGAALKALESQAQATGHTLSQALGMRGVGNLANERAQAQAYSASQAAAAAKVAANEAAAAAQVKANAQAAAQSLLDEAHAATTLATAQAQAAGAAKALTLSEADLRAVLQSIETPQERHAANLARVNALYEAGALSAAQYHRAIAASRSEMEAASAAQGNLNLALKAMVGLTIGYMVKETVASYAELAVQQDRLNRLMVASSGSTAQAAKDMQFARSTANTLGIDLTATATAFGKFQAAAQGSGVTAGQVRDIFGAVAKASAALGLSAEDTSGALLAIGQMMSKGNVQAEELRGQLGERLPGAFQLAAKAMGVTTAELNKMLDQGQVIAADFLPKFAHELDATYSSARFDGAAANVARLGNAWTELKQAFVASDWVSQVAGGLEERLRVITKAIQDAKREAARNDFISAPEGVLPGAVGGAGTGFLVGGPWGALVGGAAGAYAGRSAMATGSGLSTDAEARAYEADLKRMMDRAFPPLSPGQDTRINIAGGDVAGDLEKIRKEVEKTEKTLTASKIELLKAQKDYNAALALEAEQKGLSGEDAQQYIATELATIKARESATAATKAQTEAERQRARDLRDSLALITDQFAAERRESQQYREQELAAAGDNARAKLEIEQRYAEAARQSRVEELQAQVDTLRQMGLVNATESETADIKARIVQLQRDITNEQRLAGAEAETYAAKSQQLTAAQAKSLEALGATAARAQAQLSAAQGVLANGGDAKTAKAAADEAARRLDLEKQVAETRQKYAGDQAAQDQAEGYLRVQADAARQLETLTRESADRQASYWVGAWEQAGRNVHDSLANRHY